MSDWAPKNVIEDSYVFSRELKLDLGEEWDELHSQLNTEIQLSSLRDALQVLNLLQSINDDDALTEANRRSQIEQELKRFWRHNPSFRAR